MTESSTSSAASFVPEEPLICPACGVVAAVESTTCAACGAAYPSLVRALPQPDHGYWVAIQATFTCNACRFDSPLNHFNFGEGVICTHCGLEQRMKSGKWWDLVAFAQEVGDYGSGGPQGRFSDPRSVSNPYSYLGRASSWAKQGSWRAAPGNPLCDSCKVPLVVTGHANSVTEVACSRCGRRRRYVVPESARFFGGPVGVLADEHAEGMRDARLEQSAGAVVLDCPHCGAMLDNVRATDGIATCRYCNAPCRITMQSHARAGHGNTPAKTWWLYFQTPSGRRLREIEEAEEEEQNRAAQAKAQAEARASKAEQVRREAERKAAKKQRDAEVEARQQTNIALIVGGIFAANLAVGGVVWWFDSTAQAPRQPGRQHGCRDPERRAAQALRLRQADHDRRAAVRRRGNQGQPARRGLQPRRRRLARADRLRHRRRRVVVRAHGRGAVRRRHQHGRRQVELPRGESRD